MRNSLESRLHCFKRIYIFVLFLFLGFPGLGAGWPPNNYLPHWRRNDNCGSKFRSLITKFATIWVPFYVYFRKSDKYWSIFNGVSQIRGIPREFFHLSSNVLYVRGNSTMFSYFLGFYFFVCKVIFAINIILTKLNIKLYFYFTNYNPIKRTNYLKFLL